MDDLTKKLESARAVRDQARIDLDALGDARNRLSDLQAKAADRYRSLRLTVLKSLIGTEKEPGGTRIEMKVAAQDYALINDALTFIDKFQAPDASCALEEAEINLLEAERDVLEAEAQEQISKMRVVASAVAEANPGTVLDTKSSAAAAKLQRVAEQGVDLNNRRAELNNRRATNDQVRQSALVAGFLQVAR